VSAHETVGQPVRELPCRLQVVFAAAGNSGGEGLSLEDAACSIGFKERADRTSVDSHQVGEPMHTRS
jgi:hypothetical protein